MIENTIKEQDLYLAQETTTVGNGVAVDPNIPQTYNATAASTYPAGGNSMYGAVRHVVGSWKTYEFCCPEDDHWFWFTANNTIAQSDGTTNWYRIQGTGSLNVVARLYNASGHLIGFSESGRSFDMTIQLTYGAKYYVRVTNDRNSIGTYDLRVKAVAAPPSADGNIYDELASATSLSLNVWKNGNIYVAGSSVYYRFVPSATAYYTIETTGMTDTVGYLLDANGNQLCYNDDDGATGFNFRMVYEMRAGQTYYIRVAARGTIVGNFSVGITGIVKVSNIVVSPSEITLSKGRTAKLTASVSPAQSTDKRYTWFSNDTSVVTVDSSGTITAKAAGRADVFAWAQDGSDTFGLCVVTVKQIPVEPEEVKSEPVVPESTFADPVDVYSGAHLLNNTLMTMFGGQGLKLIARYDSTKLFPGVLGVGWYHNYEKRLEILECEARVYSSPSTYSKYVCDGGSGTYACTTPSKNGYVLTVDPSQPYPYVINCNSDHTEYYNANGYLAKIVDHQGFETVIEYSNTVTTITDTVSGKKMYLEKNTAGKVIRVSDDFSREVTLTYTGNFLTGICDLNGNSLIYTYNDDGQVLTGTDAKSTCYFTNTYDDCGRVATQRDGISGSIASTFTYEPNGKRVTTDRNGNQSVRVFNSAGLLTSHTDENGNTKTYQYDDRGNVIKETDVNGNVISKEYNLFNKPVKITDKNGNATHLYYDAVGNVTRIVYPAVNGVAPAETYVYNARNQVVQHIDLRGTVTVYTYDTSAMPASKKVGTKNAMLYSYQNGLLVSQTDAVGNVTRYSHNELGQNTAMTDADNRTTLYEYDACGNLLKTTDANGNVISYTYDCNHQKTSATDANGNKTVYSYNGNMKNDSITLPDNNIIRYEFDGEDRPVKVIDQAGNATTTVYDKAGRAISKSFPDGGIAYYEYDKVGNVIKETNPQGAVTVKTYDAAGNVLSVTDDDGNITRYQYNAMGKPVRAVNSVAGTTVYEYSEAGDLLSETDAMGNRKTYTYDAFGNKLTATDALGNTTGYTYDDNGNLLTVCDPLGNTTVYTYNCRNHLVSVKDAKDHIVRYGYDALGRRTTITDAKNHVTTVVYDAHGNVLKTLDAKGNTVSETSYNCLNLPATVTDATGKTVTYTYNALGKVLTVSDSMHHRQEYSYNSMGMNTAVRDANNGVSNATYDTLGNVMVLSGPLGGATHYTYDKMGRMIAETTSSGGTVSYGYNERNVKERITNARGQQRKCFYDACGRITGIVSPEDTVSYTYDGNGNILTVTDRNGTIKREYDALNRVTKYTDTDGNSISYEYDAVGNLTRLVYPDRTAVVYAYDANNNLVSVTDWENRMTVYTYDSNNRVVGVTKPDGSVTTTIYDGKQRVVSTVERTACCAVITGYQYEYDQLGRLSTEIDLANNRKTWYTYDSLNRVIARKVTDECGIVLSHETYAYDAAGNIICAPSGCHQYDINNRLTVFDGMTVDYDADGNMLSNGVIDCEYDSANRLVKAGDHRYVYNAEDVRIRNLCADADTAYTYDTNSKLSRLLQKTTGGVTTKYVYGLGLIGEDKYGVFKTYHFDCRGSTVAITDIAGNVTDTLQYDTYGNVTRHDGNSFVIFGYNGRDGVVTDKNGLIYMRARYYSPAMRRFVNADILHGAISDSTSLNRYSYVNGNPVSFVDPFGLSKDVDRGTVSVDSLFAILKNIKSKKDTKIATNMLASTLDQLMSFKYLFTVESEIEYSFLIDAHTTGSFSVSESSGNGGMKISSVLSEQAEILSSISFDANNISISIGSDKSISIEYSAHLDERNTITASVSGVPGISLSTEYVITTTDQYDNSVSSTLKLTHLNEDGLKPNSEPQLETVTVPSVDYGWALRLAGLGLLVWGLANNLTGVGFADDLLTIPAAVAMLTGQTA